MEIVIEIHEKDYQSIKNGHIPFNVLNAIMNGTPLPEHHGDLINKSVLEELCYQHPVSKGCLSNQLMISLRQDKDGDKIWENLLDYVPTIIEGSESE